MFMRSTKEIVGRLIDRTRPDGRGIRDGFRKVSFDVRLAPTHFRYAQYEHMQNVPKTLYSRLRKRYALLSQRKSVALFNNY